MAYSLVRKVVRENWIALDRTSTVYAQTKSLALDPCANRIYVKACLAAIRATKAVKGLAHIHGGGFPDNIRASAKRPSARVSIFQEYRAPGFFVAALAKAASHK